MRIGIDARYMPAPEPLEALGKVEQAVSLGMEGLFFRTILDISPTLDRSVIGAVRQRADELGLYLEAGLGKVNPYANPETPELRAIGDGDTLLGFRRMMEASAEFGIRELWISTGGAKPYKGRFGTDRFRTDAPWEDQLEATRRFLLRLRPIALHLGLHLNLETHEEITTFEILRLIEAVGDDVLGIVHDTANVMMRGEHPVMAAKRVAPFVRQTHVKDAYVELTDGGAYQRSVGCGSGIIDFKAVLKELNRYRPALNLSFECNPARGGRTPGTPHLIELYHPDWIAKHPDLTREEYAAYYELVRAYTERIRGGEAKSWQQMNEEPYEYEQAADTVRASRSYIDGLCGELGIARGQTLHV
ncbi:Sugar phosphate isomerase/epimerase [Cohnella sp. OV330]|uniref:sugar phosphate isomerase/epimerase family protein n=1 Tax=Cohnella sp. OV330 TaxID=1855288 RepID=UPI0008E097D0|nr:sugar phosphate isomerase/epimerase family protein [Cohnella sp. OV330]SFB50575.1 Sugar phosphate isomerase/epimerase [Cohnella sp. OV330]